MNVSKLLTQILNRLKRKCFWWKHDYYIVQVFSHSSRRIACPICKRSWAMNDHYQALLPWDKEFDELYFKVFEHKEIKPWK